MTEINSKLLNKIQSDLVVSLKFPMLLEINSMDIISIKDDLNNSDKDHIIATIISSAKRIYNTTINNKFTNILYVENVENTSQEVILFDSLMSHLEDKIKTELDIDVLKETVKGGLMLAFKSFGGDIADVLSLGQLSKTIKDTSEVLVDSTVSAFSTIEDASKNKISELITEQFISDTLIDTIEDLHGKTTDQVIELLKEIGEQKLYLSPNAKEKLKVLYNDFTEVSYVQALRLFLALLLNIADNAPKLIVIKNPQNLDIVSLNIISQYFSLVKEKNNKFPNLSFMFIYENENREEPDISYSKRTREIFKRNNDTNIYLNNQRLFLQRYGMLAKPSTNLPIMAINSSIFVGRKDELAMLDKRSKKFKSLCKKKQDHSDICMIDIIQAEPGIGKTALYNQHMKDFFHSNNIENEKELTERQLMIKLYIYNDNGMSAMGTGLVSFIDSIVREYERLEEYYITHHPIKIAISNGVVNITNSLLMDSLIDGLKDIKNIGKSIKKRISLKYATEGLSSHLVDTGSMKKRQDNEEIYFQEIVNKITQLKKVLSSIKSDDNDFNGYSPLRLFIDDIQWMDNQSAKFLITKLIKYNDIQIIGTARVSDTNSRYKFYTNNIEKYSYLLSLFEIFKLINNKQTKCNHNITNIMDICKNYDVSLYRLEGFDKKMLSELMKKAFNNSSDININYLSEKMIKFLSHSDEKEQNKTVTLFAIETLNIISDQNFYLNNNDKSMRSFIPIIKKENHAFIFADLVHSEFKNCVDEIFKYLLVKISSFASVAAGHIDKIEDNTMSLASFAVLEERLRLISMYFDGEHGEAIIQNILFSSLLGTPFDSNIINSFLQTVLNSDEPIIKPLKDKLVNNNFIHHDDFDMLEYIYQLVYRLIEFETRYIYSHTYLKIFLESKMEFFIHTCYKESSIDMDKAKSYFYKLLLKNIETEHLPSKYCELKDETFTKEDVDEHIYFVNLNVYISTKGYQVDKEEWTKQYYLAHNQLASMYLYQNVIDEAITIIKKCLKITRDNYTISEFWQDEHISTLMVLANQLMDTKEVIPVLDECLCIVKPIYENHKKKSHNYVNLLMMRALAYSNHPQDYTIDKAIELNEEALLIIKENYYTNKNEWIGDYSIVLNNLSGMYMEDPKINDEKALPLILEQIRIIEKEYLNDKERWVTSYIHALLGLGGIYAQLDYALSEIVRAERKSLVLLKPLYNKNKNKWITLYINILNNLAISYEKDRFYIKRAVNILEKKLCVIKQFYDEDPNNLREKYIDTLLELLNLYYKYRYSKEKQNKIIEEALNILTPLFYEDEEKWGDQYFIVFGKKTMLNDRDLAYTIAKDSGLFKTAKRNDPCPCGNLMKYKNCCKTRVDKDSFLK